MPYADRAVQLEYMREWSKNRQETEPWVIHYYNARKRCVNPDYECFNRYGGRGIKFLLTIEEVKTLWFRDAAWMLKQPSLDRIDNDGNYELSNCRFIELVVNVARQTYDHTGFLNPNCKLKREDIVEIKKIKHLHSQRTLAKMFGVSRDTIVKIINNIRWQDVI